MDSSNKLVEPTSCIRPSGGLSMDTCQTAGISVFIKFGYNDAHNSRNTQRTRYKVGEEERDN
jgi:hypothetical protein